jgi:hypothetical protein
MLPDQVPDHKQGHLFSLFFGLLAAESTIVVYQLVRIPADPKNSLLFGYSLNRLLMLAVALVALLVFVVLAIQSWRNPAWREKWIDRLFKSYRAFGLSMLAFALLSAVSWFILVLLRLDPDGAFLSAYERLYPLLLLAFLLGMQGLLWLPVARYGLDPSSIGSQKKWLKICLLVFLLLVVLFLVVALTGFGVVPDLYFWGPPGVPLLAWQVILVCILGCGVFLFTSWARPESAARRSIWLDVCLGLSIWTLAAGLWLSQPVQPSFFTPQRREPNHEYYPYSDAAYYDYSAESLVAGAGYPVHRVVSRPLFVLFLAILHALTGHSYTQVIFLQSLVLALFPVALFFFGKQFHSRAAGIMVALLAILRELNTIATTTMTEVSNSKMLLSDLPATLGVALLVLLIFRWLKRPTRGWMALVVGGALGLVILVRAQSMLFLPFIMLLALWVYRKNIRSWLAACVLIMVGVGLVISPWLVRNYRIGSGFVIDQPSNQTSILAQRYSKEMQYFPARKPGESDSEYSDRMVGMARKFALAEPIYTAGFITAHFLNNEIDTLAVLPIKMQFDRYQNNWTVANPFWKEMIPNLTGQDLLILLLNLFVIAIGVGSAWYRWQFLGLLPLVINVAYSLSNAVARNSGWRYILPVDWVGYFYFSLGILQLFALFLALLGRYHFVEKSMPVEKFSVKYGFRQGASVGVLFLVLGLAVPFSERAFPELYPVETQVQVASEILSSPSLQNSGVDSKALSSFLNSENAVLVHGRALYPRYYYSGQGELGNGWAALKMREGGRFTFLVIQADGMRQVMLRLSKPPANFPNASSVLIAGCRNPEGFIDAVLTVVIDPPGAAYLHQVEGPFACPIE